MKEWLWHAPAVLVMQWAATDGRLGGFCYWVAGAMAGVWIAWGITLIVREIKENSKT